MGLSVQGVQVQTLIRGLRSHPHASQPENQNTKQKQYSNKFNKDFKSGPHLKKGGGRGGKSLLESATS